MLCCGGVWRGMVCCGGVRCGVVVMMMILGVIEVSIVVVMLMVMPIEIVLLWRRSEVVRWKLENMRSSGKKEATWMVIIPFLILLQVLPKWCGRRL